MNFPGKAARTFDRIMEAGAFFAVAIMFFIMLAVTAEVIMRYFLNLPTIWVIEVTEYCLLWLTFLSAAWVLKNEEHVVMDLIVNRLSPGGRLMLNTITSLLGFAVCLVLAWYGGKVTLDLLERGHFQNAILATPSYILFAIIPVGNILLLLQFLRRAWNYFREWKDLRLQGKAA